MGLLPRPGDTLDQPAVVIDLVNHVGAHQLPEFCRSIERDQLPFSQDADPVAQGVGFLDVMGGQKHGSPGHGDAAHDLPQLAADLGVQTDGGFVKEERRRIGHERPGDDQPPLHAAGEGADHAVTPVGQIDLFQDLVNFFRQPLHPVQHPVDAQVLLHRQIPVQVVLLGDHPHQIFDGGCPRTYFMAADDGGSAIGPGQTGQHADQRALARAIGSQQAEHLAPRDGKGNAVNRSNFAVGFTDVLDFDHGKAFHQILPAMPISMFRNVWMLSRFRIARTF